MSELVLTEWTDVSGGGRVARVIINDPRRLNAMGTPLMNAFIDAMAAVSMDDDCRCVIVEGAGGRAFVGGADVFELASLDGTKGRAFITLVHRCCDALRQCPAPVIAKVDGFCIGAGMELAAAADMRVASDVSVFGMPEVAIGLPSVVEACLFPSLIGWGRTRQMMLTGENIDAETAERWGFLEGRATKDSLEHAVQRFVTPIVAAGPQAVRAQKVLMRQWEASSPVDAARAGIDCFAATAGSEENKRLVGHVVAELEEKRRQKQAGG